MALQFGPRTPINRDELFRMLQKWPEDTWTQIGLSESDRAGLTRNEPQAVTRVEDALDRLCEEYVRRGKTKAGSKMVSFLRQTRDEWYEATARIHAGHPDKDVQRWLFKRARAQLDQDVRSASARVSCIELVQAWHEVLHGLDPRDVLTAVRLVMEGYASMKPSQRNMVLTLVLEEKIPDLSTYEDKAEEALRVDMVRGDTDATNLFAETVMSGAKARGLYEDVVSVCTTDSIRKLILEPWRSLRDTLGYVLSCHKSRKGTAAAKAS